ncbi:hypothetical protein [Streptomyces lydicus]|uniref:hypothetical protein n=1 Tax=Streptomyces lydicus TaxID=47763 RepID=UPI0037A249F2
MTQGNRKLAARIAECGFSQAELARQINAEIELLTGKPGNVTDADIRRWLRGGTRWPQDRIKLCLEKVLDARAEVLGFVPRKKRLAPQEEDPVHRRALLTAAGSTALALAAPYTPDHGRLGVNDVRRFHQDYVAILRKDQAVGGYGSWKTSRLSWLPGFSPLLPCRRARLACGTCFTDSPPKSSAPQLSQPLTQAHRSERGPISTRL